MRRSAPLVLAVALACLASAAAAVAAETPDDRLDDAIRTIRAHVKSASMRLEHGVVGFGETPSPDAPEGKAHRETATTRCCSQNLDAIEEQLKSAAGDLREIADRLKTENNEDGLAAAEKLRQSFRSFEGAFQTFAAANAEEYAAIAARGMTAAIVDVEKAKAALDAVARPKQPRKNQRAR